MIPGQGVPFHPGYRAEIDGLRAVAVLSVLLYHFGVPGFSGGFAGVDVFFVISGFLIGGILYAEVAETGRLRLGNFYLRRLRRLMPAFLAMAAVSLALAWVILLPFEFREFGKSLVAASVYLSNVHFWREAGYFDSAAEDKALLHTWSLSVEEQFYIALPLVLIVLARWPRALFGALALLFAASLTASIVVTPRAHTAAFYLFPFRAWELLAGVLLAVLGHMRRAEWRVNPAMSWLGMALILVAVFVIRPGPGFPGALAILPVLGAALLILNGRDDNLVNTLLRDRRVVWVGLVSYSLYLWHWPILTFSTYWRGAYAGPVETVFWLAVSVAAAWASWRFVEQPFRREGGWRGWPLVAGVVLSSAALVGAGLVIWQRDGMIERFPRAVQTHIAASADFLQDWSRCDRPATGPLAGLEVCRIGPEGAPRALVWGDSHVRALKEGIDQAAHDAGTPAWLIWNAGCPPLFDVFKVERAATRDEDAACLAANRILRDALPGLAAIDRVLLIGRWTYYLHGTGTGRDAHNRITLSSIPDGSLPDLPQEELFRDAMALTTKALASSVEEVFVLRQLPEFPDYDSRAVARGLAHGRLTPAEAEALATAGPEVLEPRIAAVEDALNMLANQGRITLLDPWRAFCEGGTCRAMKDGQALYFDNNHVTNRTALAIRDVFAPFFEMPDG